MAELDRLKADLALLRLQQTPQDATAAESARQADARAEQSRREHEKFRACKETADAPFRPGNELKKRFRQLAQKIHPDRAQDEADRAWRTQLMSEANRAYRAGDAAALDEVLALWLEGRTQGGPAVSPAPTSAMTSALTEALQAQVAGIRRRISAIAAELDQLYGSKLYELFAAARVAARQGRDLLEEMVARIDAQIVQAQALLDNFGPQA